MLINTLNQYAQSTLRQHLGREWTNFCKDAINKYYCQSIPMSWSTLGCILSDCRSSVDQVLIEMFIECWLSINQDAAHQVLIEMLIEC